MILMSFAYIHFGVQPRTLQPCPKIFRLQLDQRDPVFNDVSVEQQTFMFFFWNFSMQRFFFETKIHTHTIHGTSLVYLPISMDGWFVSGTMGYADMFPGWKVHPKGRWSYVAEVLASWRCTWWLMMGWMNIFHQPGFSCNKMKIRKISSPKHHLVSEYGQKRTRNNSTLTQQQRAVY